MTLILRPTIRISHIEVVIVSTKKGVVDECGQKWASACAPSAEWLLSSPIMNLGSIILTRRAGANTRHTHNGTAYTHEAPTREYTL